MTSYQPWYVGQTYPAWDIPLNTDSGADNISTINLSSFVMTFINTNAVPPSPTTGTGTFSVKSNNPAEVYYQPTDADVASAFNGEIQVSCKFPGGFTAKWDPIPFVIKAS
jgi:hypothetical protein